jgi:hypothetical protein
VGDGEWTEENKSMDGKRRERERYSLVGSHRGGWAHGVREKGLKHKEGKRVGWVEGKHVEGSWGGV